MKQGKNILFIGLGTMGYPMAGHLAKYLSRSGDKLFVANRTNKKAIKWSKEFTGENIPWQGFGETLIEVKKNNSNKKKERGKKALPFDVVITCLGRNEDVEEVFFGKKDDSETKVPFIEKGLAGFLRENTIVIDHSTISPATAKKISNRLKRKKVNFLDAPISGGEIGAQNGKLSIMVGGNKAVFKRALPYMDAYSKNGGKVVWIGESGSGQMAKMVNQICIAGLLQGLSEGINFAKKGKLDFKKVFEAIKSGAAQSWQMDNRASTMWQDKYDFGFQIKWMIKDLTYATEQAKKNKGLVPMAEEVLSRYKKLDAAGHGKKDTSALKLYDTLNK